MGCECYTEAKSYRPISLTSFLLKTLERMVDRFIRDGALVRLPIHQYQFAYQAGKSAETALHEVVLHIEKALSEKEVALCASLDIEGAFDQSGHDVIINAAQKHGINSTICRWINHMLKSREIQCTIFKDTVKILTTRGCPQGGVLSPLLWNLVANELIVLLNKKGFRTIGFADDVFISITGKFLDTLSNLLQSALNLVQNWCTKVGLKVNPNKTVIVPFTNRRKLQGLTEPDFFGTRINFSNECKFLGVILDKKLTWKPHLDTCIKNASRAFWACRRAFGKTWGLNPRVLLWIYTAVIRPRIIYASSIWWTRTKVQITRLDLNKFQRSILVAVTGSIRTTPGAALEVILNIPPLPDFIESYALRSLYRFKCGDHKSKILSYGHTNVDVGQFLKHIYHMHHDFMISRFSFHKPFKILFPSREDWEMDKIKCNGIVWYADGSRIENRTGAGIFCKSGNVKISFSLGIWATVFQAEVFAISACASYCLSKNYKGKNIYIFSDSQAALKSLGSCQFNSKLVWDCHLSLVELATSNKVQLCWIPGHSGISGNETVDLLAKKGACESFLGPEPACGLPMCTAKMAFGSRLFDKHVNYWTSLQGMRQAKALLEGPSKVKAKQIICLNRKDCRFAIGILTGHCSLGRHLHILGVGSNPLCRKCEEYEETPIHILCECDALAAERLEAFGSHNINPNDLKGTSISELLSFFRRAGFKW